MAGDKEELPALSACNSWWPVGSAPSCDLTIDRGGLFSKGQQVINWAAWASFTGFTLGWW